jgi:MFS family permease
VIFGHFGDRTGRKSMFARTMTLMGVAIVAIACCPPKLPSALLPRFC